MTRAKDLIESMVAQPLTEDFAGDVKELQSRAQAALSAVIRLSAQAEKVMKGQRASGANVVSRSDVRKLDRMEGDLNTLKGEVDQVSAELSR